MGRALIGVLAFAGGVAVGLYVAKLYVKSTITGDLDSALNAVHLGGGQIQSFVDNTVVPFAVN